MAIRHIAFIPDGNRRWARSHGLPTFEGHRRGYNKVKDVGEWCLDRGIEFFSIWGFSTENWKRSQEEVGYLMDLIVEALTRELDFYNEKGIRVKVIGRREGFSDRVLAAIEKAEQATAANKKAQLNLCLNYGGQAEIVDGIKSMLVAGVSSDQVTPELFSSHLWSAEIPTPDLIVRTSGEKRLSGFYAWSGAYSELFFLEKHWPDFGKEDLDGILTEFEKREKRFGK